MPRPKLNTLEQPPYPTPSTSPTSPRSTPPSLKGPNAPPSPTKPRLGHSILGQLLASHKGRDHYTLANDAALSLETIRPKEQRRSGLPASWAFGFSRTTTPVPSPSTLNTVAPLAINMANRKGRADPDQHYQTVLPSAWLEKILAGLSKSRTEVPPHYATLPKDGFPGSSTAAPRSVMSMFDSKGKSPRPSNDTAKPSSKSKRFSDRLIPSPLAKPGTLSPTPVGALLHPGRSQAPHKMVRRSSVCELALGEDARELFQQNRPKTLSSAVISSTVVKQQKGRVQEAEKGLTSESTTSTSSSSSSSSSTSTSTSSSTSLDNSEPPTVTESVSGTPPTTTVTRGRFTIESSSPTPMTSPVARTRTLSTASTSSCPMAPVTSFSSSYLAPPTLTPGGTRPISDQSTISLSPASPLSFSLPSSSMNSVRPSPTSRSFSVPSGSPPPSNGSTSSSSSSSSNPISIPRATRSNHQRTHSNSSVQSSGSASSSRRSQIIIPPANTASFQFASFSSMASSSSGTGNGNAPPSSRPPVMKRANSTNNNNFRNLSIHVLGKDTDDEEDAEVPPGPESDSSQVFHLESSVHPLDHPMMLSSRANTSPNLLHHQTMHRVHPQPHVHVDSPNDSTGSSSMTRCGSFCCSSGRSSLNSLSNFGANEMPTSVEYGPACHAGYFRQRSLSTTHLDSSLYNNNSGSSPVPVPVPVSASSYHHHHSQHLQPQRHSSSWSDRPGRRTYGSLSHESSHLPHHLHQLHNRNSTPSLLNHGHGQLLDSPGSMSKASFGETSDVVMVKKSATGRMFTVERTIPVSPTRCSRFIVVSAEEEAAQAAENGGGSRSHTPLSSAPTQ
ncbi:hypothetical protein BG003_008539 [Podila horticola]|nr:hypothetical protein BG003_008539 [Podila horticola]